MCLTILGHYALKGSRQQEEAGVGMITNLVNQVIVDGIISAEWELSIIANCFKGRRDSLERRNYRGLILLDHIQKKA